MSINVHFRGFHHLEEPFTLRDVVFHAIGAASVCWSGDNPLGEFDTAQAKEIAEALIVEIDNLRPEIDDLLTKLLIENRLMRQAINPTATWFDDPRHGMPTKTEGFGG